jgi:WS/DGAT/MGAT family acyltransferase
LTSITAPPTTQAPDRTTFLPAPPEVVIERASPNDMMQRATDAGAAPTQVGAVIILGAEPPLDLAIAREQLVARVAGVRRLRQRLISFGVGTGRPIWVDDAGFDPNHHLHTRSCPPPGDEAALLRCATDLVGTRLPDDRPPWAATIVTGLAGGRSALIVVFDHVLADGIGGLAVLANLVDGMPPATAEGFPRPAPSRRAVAVDAWSCRMAALGRWRTGLDHLRAALAEVKPGLRESAPRTSLNQPTGKRRATRIVQVDLDAVRATAHAQGGTVNDVVLAAVAGALRGLLLARGEDIDRLVVSIPISSRRAATADHLGNEVGVLPVTIPTTGDLAGRVAAIARITGAHKSSEQARGSSAAVVGPIFRALGSLHLVRPFIDHQRMINTLVTNLRGPEDRLSFAGTPITDVIPMSGVMGNVTVAFAVLSYAGTLTITINADPDACPDLDALAKLLGDALGPSPV